MKFWTAILLGSLVFSLPALSQEADTETSAVLDTEEEKISYSVGTRFGKFLLYGKDIIDPELVKRGMVDVMEGREPVLGKSELDASFSDLERRMAENRKEAMSEEGRKYLETNAQKDGVIQLPSGLQYKVLEEGVGPTPSATDTVSTNYRGKLIDGTEFDSSYDRGKPTSFPVGGVIAGWTEALLLMSTGSKWELYVPPDLAYGERGMPRVIPPHATLIFEIELLAIEN